MSSLLIKAALLQKKADGLLDKVVASPITQYGLLGAGAGGTTAILKHLLSKGDGAQYGPEGKKKKSLLNKILSYSAIGGLAGGGVGAGSKLLDFGYNPFGAVKSVTKDMPFVQEAIPYAIAGGTALPLLVSRRGARNSKVLGGNVPGLSEFGVTGKMMLGGLLGTGVLAGGRAGRRGIGYGINKLRGLDDE